MNNLGVDLGRVIKGPTKDDYNKPFPGAFETISKLVKKFNNVYIVSRVNSEQRERAIKWLEAEDFYTKTGIPTENIYYCFDRRDKAMFAAGLNLRYFIDDRPACLLPMKNVTKILFNPSESDLEKYKDDLKELVIVNNWDEVGRYFKLI